MLGSLSREAVVSPRVLDWGGGGDQLLFQLAAAPSWSPLKPDCLWHIEMLSWSPGQAPGGKSQLRSQDFSAKLCPLLQATILLLRNSSGLS